MTAAEKWYRYEAEKIRLRHECKDWKEYEDKLREVAKRLGI